jgi:hypothetical protein
MPFVFRSFFPPLPCRYNGAEAVQGSRGAGTMPEAQSTARTCGVLRVESEALLKSKLGLKFIDGPPPSGHVSSGLPKCPLEGCPSLGEDEVPGRRRGEGRRLGP